MMLHPAMAKDNVAVITGGPPAAGLRRRCALLVRHEDVHRRYRRRCAEDGRGKDVGGFSPAFGESQTSLRKRVRRSSRFANAAGFVAILTDARFVLMCALAEADSAHWMGRIRCWGLSRLRGVASTLQEETGFDHRSSTKLEPAHGLSMRRRGAAPIGGKSKPFSDQAKASECDFRLRLPVLRSIAPARPNT